MAKSRIQKRHREKQQQDMYIESKRLKRASRTAARRQAKVAAAAASAEGARRASPSARTRAPIRSQNTHRKRAAVGQISKSRIDCGGLDPNSIEKKRRLVINAPAWGSTTGVDHVGARGQRRERGESKASKQQHTREYIKDDWLDLDKRSTCSASFSGKPACFPVASTPPKDRVVSESPGPRSSFSFNQGA